MIIIFINETAKNGLTLDLLKKDRKELTVRTVEMVEMVKPQQLLLRKPEPVRPAQKQKSKNWLIRPRRIENIESRYQEALTEGTARMAEMVLMVLMVRMVLMVEMVQPLLLLSI